MNTTHAPERTRRVAHAVSQHFPPLYRDRLISAAAHGDFVAIDRITDEMASAGLVRPRSDGSRFNTSANNSN